MARYFWKNNVLGERQLLAASAGYSLQSRKGFTLPAKDHISVRAPEQHGATYIDTFFRPRDLSFVVIIKGCSVSDFEEKLQALLRLLNPLDEGELQVSTRNNGLFTLACRPVTKTTLRMQSGIVGELLVQVRADDPFFHTAEEFEAFIGVVSAGLTIPFTIPAIISSGGVTVSFTIVNDGDIRAFPIIVIGGTVPLVNPEFINDTTGESLLMSTTVPGLGDSLTLDMGQRTAVLRSGPNVIAFASGTFWALQRGSNDIRIKADGANPFSGTLAFTEGFFSPS